MSNNVMNLDITTNYNYETTALQTKSFTDSQVTGTTTPALPGTSYITFAAVSPYIYTFVGLVGIVANTFVADVIATSPSLRKRIENSLLFNQSLIDGVAGLLLVANLTTSLPMTQTGGFWDLVCRYWMSGTPLFAALQASIFNLVIITIERYFEIVHPIAHKVHQSRQLITFLVALPWALGFFAVIYIPVFKQGLGDGQCRQGNTWPNLSAQAANGWTSLCLKYLMPLAVFIFCYSHMIIALRRSKHVIAAISTSRTNSGTSAQSSHMERARRNVIKTLLLVTIAHVIFWGPNQGIYLATQVFNIFIDRNGALYSTSVVAIYVNGCINPIIYAACYTAFKDDLRRRFGHAIRSNRVITATSNATSG